MPFKANQDRRHHISKQRPRVTNWSADDIALRQRAWTAEPRGMRGNQPRYWALAITKALTLRAIFRLALRQTEGCGLLPTGLISSAFSVHVRSR